MHVCMWKLLVQACVLMPPSTGLVEAVTFELTLSSSSRRRAAGQPIKKPRARGVGRHHRGDPSDADQTHRGRILGLSEATLAELRDGIAAVLGVDNSAVSVTESEVGLAAVKVRVLSVYLDAVKSRVSETPLRQMDSAGCLNGPHRGTVRDACSTKP